MKASTKAILYAAVFALLNVAMYLLLRRFWIGGSSFLPMIGNMGKNRAFLLAFVINLGVIAGSAIGALMGGEFRLRMPKKSTLPNAVFGGFLIGIGVTLCPGTCTTCFVTGIPMLSVASFLSAAGILLGAFIVFVWRRQVWRAD